MPTYPLFGSTQLDPRISGEAAPTETGVVDELSKGYRRGLRGAGSSLAELAGSGAEALGATEVASGARKVAGSLREAAGAPELAPAVGSIRDVNSVGSGLRWGAGMMGEMTPVLAAAVAGGALTKNPMVGGTIAMAPFEAGDIASRQDRTQGTAGSRLAEAAGGGLASAVVGNVLPTHIMGKFGKGLRGDSSFLPAMGKNIAEGAAVGYLSEAGSEGVKQLASRREFDTEAITEAGLGGAAFGGAFGVPAGLASYAKGNAESIGKTATALKDKGMELGGKLKDKAQSKLEDEGIDLGAAFDKGTDLVKRGRAKVDESVDRVINGQPLGDTLKEFATATGDRAKEIMDLSAEEKGKKVREWATKMADDTGFNEEKRNAVVQAAQKAGDRTAEITIAAAKKAYDAAKRAREQIIDFSNSFDADNRGGSKKSEDYSGPQKAILEALQESGLTERRPDLFDHNDNINALASTLRKTMVQLAKGPLSERQVKGLTRVLGDDTMPVLSSLRRAVLGDADTENFFKNVGNISDAQRRSDEFHKQIKSLMTPEALDKYEKAAFNLGELEDQLVADARRKGGDSTFGTIALNNTTKEAYRTFFGPKSDAAMTLVEKYAKQGQNKNPAQLDMLPESKKLLKKPEKSGREDAVQTDRLDEAGNLVEASEGGFDEQGRKVQAEQTKRLEFGLGPVRRDGGQRSVLNGEPYEDGSARLAQHLGDIKGRYPDHAVKFDKESGRIVAEKSVADGTLTDDAEMAMRLDTKKYANSPSRLEIGDKKYDAMRVTSMTRKSMKKEDGERADVQLARAFHEGVAALIERHGAENVNIPDSTLIGSINGVKMTAGQAKNLKARLTKEDRVARDLDAKLIDTQRDWLSAVLAKDDAGVAEAKKVFDATTKLADEFKAERMMRDAPDRNLNTEVRELGYELMSLRGSIEAAVKTGDKQATRELAAIYSKKLDRREEIKEQAELAARQTPENTAGDAMAGDKAGNIHSATSKGVRGEALVNRSDMTGAPHSAPNVSRHGEENVRKNTLSDAIARWEDEVTTEPGRRLVARAKVLYDNIDIMSANDRQRFYDTAIDRPESSEAPARASRARDALEVVNTLARKYAKQIEGRTKWSEEDKGAPINQVIKPGAVGRIPEPPMPKPPAGTTASDHSPKLPDPPPPEARGIDIRDKRGTPSPKAVAAKKAALLKAASSSDPALLQELRTTDDAKGLQRALEVLPDGAARDAATARMSELVKDDATAYQLQTRKYSLVGVGIHNDLNKPGFPATHDSPIKHEGKFDWRKHKGKGEGNAAFGAGTYLSTADGVHRSYKSQFSGSRHENERLQDALVEARSYPDATAAEIRQSTWESLRESMRDYDDAQREDFYEALRILQKMTDAQLLGEKSPTYEVSVNIEPHQILDWDKPLREQSEPVQKALAKAGFASTDYRGDIAAISKRTAELNERLKNTSREEHAHFEELEKWHDENPIDSAMGGRADPRDDRIYWIKERNKLHDQLATAKKEMTALQAKAARSFAFSDGADIYRTLTKKLGSQEKASDYLQSLGILGHKYAASGGKNDRHPNYVIYDDSKIETNYVHFSRTSVDKNATGPVNKQAVEEHINTVLGGSIRTFWPQLSVMDWAGDYTHVQKLIRISVQSLNPMSVAYHESMHAFVANLRDMGATDVVAALEKAANSPHNIVQVREFFKNEPEVLKQLSDPEERVAYMYQLWASGHLKPAPGARNIFEKIAAFFRKILGVWSNDQRAERIMEYFNSGEYGKNMSTPNAVRRALMAPGRNSAYEAAQGLGTSLMKISETLFATGSARVRETGVPALQDIADAVKRQDGDTRGGTRGFIHASRIAATKMRTQFATRIGDVNQAQLADALEALQKNTRATTPEGRLIARAVHKQLQEARQYMLNAGADVGNLGKDYFPRVWDVHYISKNQQAFRNMLEPYVRSGQLKGSVDKLVKNLVASEGHEFSVETDMPGFQFGKERVLGFIKDADAAEFLNKDLLETMHSYITQAARRAEWFRLFGEGKLDAMMARARKEGATPEQIAATEQYLKGVNGTLGDNISPALRRIYGNTIVYQNVRLLPLAVFSSLVDPMGIIVRGGTVRDAWQTFTKGMREIPGSFRKKSQKPGQMEEIAELVGVIDSAMLNHITSDMYTQGMVGGTAKRINNAFFRYNMMESLNRSFRVGATEAALKFIAKHADGTASRHSQRWIKELGLDPSDVVKYKDRIALTKAEGLTEEAEVRMHAAINQWVDGAVLRPDAADKPIWMNDPHYAIFAHLKQFVYAFQKTILARVWHEAKNGNYTPTMAMASYVPMMIASDFIKGMIQGGGEQPEWKAGWGPAEYVGYGVQRAGLLGVGQFGIDAYENASRGGLGVTALGGPAVEQLVDVLGTLSGRKQFGAVALDALPANALYSEAVGPGR